MNRAYLASLKTRLPDFIALTRLDKPIGIFLLLWPTMTALWIATAGHPNARLLFIFISGVVLMRSAGCVINDYADRHWDGKVARTQSRPLTTGKITPKEALVLFAALVFCAFLLVCFTNLLTLLLSGIAVILASLYPFAKRYTHFPQVVLGAAFSMGIPMAFAAATGTIPVHAWLLFLFNWVWTVAYDTQYAMADREDDAKIGIKSIALFFGENDVLAIALLQSVSILPLWLMMKRIPLSPIFLLGILAIIALFIYQHFLIRTRTPEKCFHAFLNNAWVGIVLYTATVSSHPWSIIT